MRAEDFGGVYEVNDDAAIEDVLKKRYGHGVNEIWLSQGIRKNPAIAILVRGDEASLHYFPQEGHPGFRSSSDLKDIGRIETSTFFINIAKEEIEVSSNSIVPFSIALNVAKEFFASPDLPKSVEWFEL